MRSFQVKIVAFWWCI